MALFDEVEWKPGGQYMQGGLFSKAIDLLSTTNYMSAGAADALLEGRSPLAGMREGLENRTSFADVLEKRGVPHGIATPLGIVGDIALDPATWMTGGLALGIKGKHIGRVKEFVERLSPRVRSAEEVARAVGSMSEVDRTAAMTELMRYGRRQAAQAAYQEALADGPVAALRSARRAAKDYNPTVEELHRLGPGFLASSRFGPISSSQGGTWQRAWNSFRAHWVFNMADRARKDIGKFGRIGGEFAERGTMQESIAQGLIGETMFHGNRIIRLVGKNKDDNVLFFKLGNGLVHPDEAPPRLREALRLWEELAEARFLDLSRAGVRQTHTVLSVAFSQLATDRQQAIMGLLARGGVDPEGVFRAGTNERFAQLVQQAGGKITADGAITMPLTRRAFYVPLYTKRGFMVGRDSQINFQDMVRDFMELDPSLSIEHARALAERTAMEVYMSPNDIRRQFQVGRLSSNVPIDEKVVEMNASVWINKWGRDVSDRIAQAMAWGGEDEIFKGMKEAVRLQGDRIPGFKGHEELQKMWDMTTGQYHSALRPAVSLISQAANLFFLGPKTALLQATQLVNNAGWTGIANSLAGVAATMADPAMRGVVQRLGVVLPGMTHAADADAMAKLTGLWHKVIGVAPADKLVRTAGAMSSALHGLDTVDNLMRAVRSGNQAATAKFSRILAEYGADAQAVIRRGGEVIDDEVGAFMLRGANATNFTNSALSLPSVFREPGGQFLLKFKTYAFQQANFIRQLLVRAKNGDTGPALRYAAAFPWVYGMTFRAINELRERPIDTEDDWNMIENMMLTGAFGFWGDAMMALGSPSEALRLGVFAGPNASLITKTTGGIAEMAKGEADLSEPWKVLAAGRQYHALLTGEQQ